MNRLALTQIKRIFNKKILCLYLLVATFMAVETCVSYLKNPADEFAQVYSGARFPLVMLHSQIIILVPIILAILSAILLIGETASGMLKQPLLQGYSRRELATAKILGLLFPALMLYFSICAIKLNQFFSGVVSNFSFLYYIYAFADYNNINLDFSTLICGVPICIITGIIFYILIHRRFKKVEIY